MVETRNLQASSSSIIEKDQVDRISMLPDALIHRVLSFIDTICAVQTCVLSKRWTDIWKSLPFLNFDMFGYPLDELDDLIDRVLILRNECNIQCFRLRLCYYDRGVTKSFSRWVDTAISRNVQEVTMEFRKDAYSNFVFEIPHRLLNCKSLKKLTLVSYDSCVYTILPESMSLPQLEFMRLGGILLDDVELSRRLFSSCPLLESLDVTNCDIQTDNQWNFTVESPSLKKFAYTHRCSSRSFLRPDITPKIIKLSAPNLTSFTCNYGDEYQQLSRVEKEMTAISMVKLLVAVDMVERLYLSPGFLEDLSRATGLLNSQLHCLCNLQSLRLETWFTGGSLRTIAYLLKISPNIKSLILKLSGPNSTDVGDDWEVGFSLPGMLSHLNTVRIENLEGCDAELKLLSSLLKNAKVLEEVALYPRGITDSPPEVKEQFMDKLRALQRASTQIKMRWGGTLVTHLS